MLAGSIHISHNRNVFKKPVEITMKILCAIEPVCKNVSLKLFYTNGTDCFILASLQNDFSTLYASVCHLPPYVGDIL